MQTLRSPFILALVLIIAMPSLALAAIPRKAAVRPPAMVVVISLSNSEMTIRKASRTGTQELTAPIIPIRPGTIRPGRYQIQRMTENYRSPDGNVVLENLIRLNGGFNIRTARLFHQWLGSDRPANRAIVLEPETGSLLYSKVLQYGPDRTLVVITP